MKPTPLPPTNNMLIDNNNEDIIPQMESIMLSDEAMLNRYKSELHQFFLHGVKTGKGLSEFVFPLKFSTELQKKMNPVIYPVYFDTDNQLFNSLYNFLNYQLKESFEEKTYQSLLPILPEVINKIADNSIIEADNYNSSMLIADFIGTVELKIPEFSKNEDLQNFIDHVNHKVEALIPKLINFSQSTVFNILDHQLKRRNEFDLNFKKKIQNGINILKDLLYLQEDQSEEEMQHLDFAKDLMAFDKIKEMAVSNVSALLPQNQFKKVKDALNILSSALEIISRNKVTIFTSETILNDYNLSLTRSKNFEIVSGNDCTIKALNQSKKDLTSFVKIIASLRLAELFKDNLYKQDLHDAYFEHFDVSYLSDDDLRYLRPVFVVESAKNLMANSNLLFNMISEQHLLKILSINKTDDIIALEESSIHHTLDIASLSIFRRSCYVFQGGINDISRVSEAISKGLEYKGTALWNILVPPAVKENRYNNFHVIDSMLESRLFPSIEYEVSNLHFDNHQIDLSDNLNVEKTFPTFFKTIETLSKKEDNEYVLTMADSISMIPYYRAELEIIPPKFQNSDFIPLHEYLALDRTQIFNKTPFIWMVNDQNKLRQVAIPLKWVQFIRKRIEYWEFLQNLAGVNNSQLQTTINAKKEQWAKEKDEEIEQLKNSLTSEFETTKSIEIQNAISRILIHLMGDEENLEQMLEDAGKINYSTPVVSTSSKVQKPIEEIEKKTDFDSVEPSSQIIDKPWVETEECTSCKDCITVAPSVFKYNENRQAYVHDPKGGSFAQIVQAAEKCPAMCIHPGKPQNKNEKDLDKWMKRAEKFN